MNTRILFLVSLCLAALHAQAQYDGDYFFQTRQSAGPLQTHWLTPAFSSVFGIDDEGVLSMRSDRVTIAGIAVPLGTSITRDEVMGMLSNGLVKRTAANSYSVASAGTDYVAPSGTLALGGFSTITGTLSPANGGTGLNMPLHAIPVGFNSSTMSYISTSTANRVIITGTLGSPSFGQIDLSTSAVTGLLPNANLAHSTITINGSDVSLGGSVTTAVLAGNAFTGANSITLASVGTTATAGLTLATSTAASSGNQQYSPLIMLSGNGWATSGGSSQPCDYYLQVQPVQGTAPNAKLAVKRRVNLGSWTTAMELTYDQYGNTQMNVGTSSLLDSGGAGVVVGGCVFGGQYSTTKGMSVGSDGTIGFSSVGTAGDFRSSDAFFKRAAAASIQLGADSATPVAQTLCFANGTGTNISGADATIKASNGTGTGGSGKIKFQTSATGSSGSTANTARDVLILKPDGSIDLPATTVEAASDPASTHKVTIYINGTRYKILAIQE